LRDGDDLAGTRRRSAFDGGVPIRAYGRTPLQGSSMKLSDDKARRLTRLVWLERARLWLPMAAAAAVVLGAAMFLTETQIEHADRTVDVRVHDATVVEIKRTAARGASVVHVHLDDGRDVDAVSLFRIAPTAGAHVVVNEARHASGKLSYDVVRFAP
jgi:hypothetical protein